jgi:enoyl-CoA hydratase
MKLETIDITETDGVAHIQLNRPGKANAVNGPMWSDLRAAFNWLNDSSARVGVLSGRGKHFTAGIDLGMLAQLQSEVAGLSPGERTDRLHGFILDLQECVGAAESCRKPILAAIHGACIGGGVDIITACDMRYATADARFSVKEIDLAIVADLGTLQRLPRLIGDGLARELAYTGRAFDGKEALAMRLVNQVFPDQEALLSAALQTARTIARKSPATIRGIKQALNYGRDNSVAEGLAQVASHNATYLFSDDLAEAMAAAQEGREPRFSD